VALSLYNLCNDFIFVSYLADVGSEDIQVLPNGLAFITSVSRDDGKCRLFNTINAMSVDVLL